ncbi:Na+/H+ antiporter subunit D [Amnibacterium endophyticum]|uniref:Na+/H+ antiporter subunit D n=1 Tax=Amnibacterium endophyticum TaxID=2109337 RepID=A0ABW4LGR7_9MICO
MTALVPLVVLIPVLGAGLALLATGRPRLQRTIAAIALTAVLGIGIVLMVAVADGAMLVLPVGGWPIPFGIVLVVDRVSALLLTVSAAVLLAVLVFSIGQGIADGDDREAPVSIFYPTYLVLATGVFDAFVAGDLFNLYVGFEILLVASYVLITVGGTEPRIRAGTTYIVVSLVSSALFLAAVGAVYAAVGTVNIAQIAQRAQDLPQGVQILLHVMLLTAFGIKAAVFPLSFWLPDSYPTAPAPVTAVFAGLLTKVGVYAIIRTETTLFPGPELNPVLLVIAILTMVVGVLGAIAQADIKRMLSFTLVSHIGYLIMGVGLGTAAGTAATIFYAVHHIVVQTTLFLTTGLIERRAGTTTITRLGGLLWTSPAIAVLFLLPALNLGGIPPFSGFLGKLGLLEAGVSRNDPLAFTVVGVAVGTSLLTLYPLVRVWNLSFWRPAEQVAQGSRLTDQLHEDPYRPAEVATRALARPMVWATGGMVALGLLLTVLAGPLYDYSSNAGATLQNWSVYVEGVLGR